MYFPRFWPQPFPDSFCPEIPSAITSTPNSIQGFASRLMAFLVPILRAQHCWKSPPGCPPSDLGPNKLCIRSASHVFPKPPDLPVSVAKPPFSFPSSKHQSLGTTFSFPSSLRFFPPYCSPVRSNISSALFHPSFLFWCYHLPSLTLSLRHGDYGDLLTPPCPASPLLPQLNPKPTFLRHCLDPVIPPLTLRGILSNLVLPVRHSEPIIWPQATFQAPILLLCNRNLEFSSADILINL